MSQNLHRPKTRNQVWLLTLFIVVLAFPAYGYVDPGSGYLVLQVIAAIFVGFIFSIKKFSSKIKSLITRPFAPKKSNGSETTRNKAA